MEDSDDFKRLKEAAEELGLNLEGYILVLKYSKKIKGYRSKAIFNREKKRIEFRLGDPWKNCSWEIQKGAVQVLMCKLFNKKKKTLSITLMDSFLKKVHSPLLIHEEIENKILEDSFHRVNKNFFDSSMAVTRIRFGKPSKTILGKYNFDSDEIIISSILKEAPAYLLDYVMYHELLHKKHGYGSSLKRQYHTKRFKEDEKNYPMYEKIDEELERFIMKH